VDKNLGHVEGLNSGTFGQIIDINMSVKEYLEKRMGRKVGITRSGFPKEVVHIGKVLRIESDVAVLGDDKGREWAIPLDKVLLVGPADAEDDERAAGFRGAKNG